jgi:hypothetical protein
MARRTIDDIDTELHMALGKRTDFTAATRNFVIDQAYYHIASAIRHPELETTATPTLSEDTDNVALAADFWFPELVMNTTDNRQIYSSSVPLTEVRSKPTGDPSTYSRWGSKLYFDKIAGAAKVLRIWYTKRPAELGSSASSVLDVLYDQLWLMFSIKFAFEQFRDYDQAAKMQLAIDKQASELKTPWRMTKTEDSHRSIRVRMR